MGESEQRHQGQDATASAADLRVDEPDATTQAVPPNDEPRTGAVPVGAESAEPTPDSEADPTPEPSSEPSPGPPPVAPRQFDPRELRVSDAEREHVVGLLQKAIGRGLLDLDEFTERADIALAARNRGELNAVLTDLPGLVHRDAVAPAPAFPGNGYGQPPMPHQQPMPYPAMQQPVPYGTPYGAPAQYAAPGDRVELKAHGSSLKRSGNWHVPGHLLVRNKYGETKLDFTQAQVAEPVVHVELDAKWGSVELIIPDHAAVDLNTINEVKWGSVSDKTNSNGQNGTPRYVVTGRVHGGSLTVRNPRRGLFG